MSINFLPQGHKTQFLMPNVPEYMEITLTISEGLQH